MNPFRTLVSRLQSSRHKSNGAQKGLVARKFRPSASLRFDELEARLTPDAKMNIFGFPVTAVGASATFTDDKNVTALPSNLQFQSDDIVPPRFGDWRSYQYGFSPGRIISTNSPVRIDDASGKPLVIFPEGADFRQFTFTPDFQGVKNLYQDIVPHFGLISMPNGLSSSATAASQQTITVGGAASGTFTLKWNGQTTAPIAVGATADKVQTALAALSNIGSDSVAVAAGKTAGTYTVTFGGNIYSQPPLIVAAGSGGATASVAPVTETYLTKRDKDADKDGIGSLILPVSFVRQAGDRPYAPPLSVYSDWGNNERESRGWKIPANLASTFPIAVSPAFTPSEIRFGNAGQDVRLLGISQFPSLVGAINSVNSSSWGYRVLATTNGLDLLSVNNYYGFPPSPLQVVSAATDSTGKPRPVTFNFGGLAWEVEGAPNASLTSSSPRNFEIQSFYAKASFAGGSLRLLFGDSNTPGLRISAATGTLSVGPCKASGASFTLGGFVMNSADPSFSDDKPFVTYDAAAQKFKIDISAYKASRNNHSGEGALLTSEFSTPDDFFTQTVTPIKEQYTYWFQLKVANGVTDRIDFGASAEAVTAALQKINVYGGRLKDLVADIKVVKSGDTYTIRFGAPTESGKSVLRSYRSDAGVQQFVVEAAPRESGNFAELDIKFTRGTADPIRIFLQPNNAFTITKGVLDPVQASVGYFEVGRSTVRLVRDSVYIYFPSSIEIGYGTADATWVRYNPIGTGLSLGIAKANVYDKDGQVKVPGNSLVVTGQTKTPFSAAGVSLTGTANLGSANSNGLVVTNSFLNSLTFPIDAVTVGNLQFAAATVGSAKPMIAGYYPPPVGVAQSYVITGGAALQPGGLVFKSGVKANFGGNGSDGLRIVDFASNNAKFTFNFGIADAFLAGSNAIKSATGPTGLKVNYDPVASTYSFQGDALLDFNPKSPYDPNNVVFSGQELQVSASAPLGVTNFAANRLDSSTLNFFFANKASLNGFILSPQPTTDPLRVVLRAVGDDTIGGDFAMVLAGNVLNGKVVSSTFSNGKYPAAGLPLDFRNGTRDWTLGGVQLSGLGVVNLTNKLSLTFTNSKFDALNLADGTATSSQPNVIEAVNGEAVEAVLTSNVEQQVGDVKFSNFKAKYDFKTTPRAWNFTGPGTYFGKAVTVGAGATSPIVKIGGTVANAANAAKGFQLTLGNMPKELNAAEFPLPKYFTLSGLTFDLQKFAQGAVEAVAGVSKTYTLSTSEYTVKLGRTEITLQGTLKIKVSIKGPEIVSVAVSGKQDTVFTIGNATFQVKELGVVYDVAGETFKINGSATFTYKAANAKVTMNVNLGDAAEPGLIIKNGVVDSLKVSVDGSFTLFNLTVTVPSKKALTLEYNAEKSEYIIYGTVTLSTKAQGGVKVIDNLVVSLGTKTDKPGIRIVGGSVEEVDIALNGKINLFGLTASPKNLRVHYSAEENQVQITGGVEVTLASGLVLKAGLPGKGLLIDTETGDVQIRGVSLGSDGDIKFGEALTIKNLNVLYADDGRGNVTISAKANLVMKSGLEVGGSFKIVNGALDSISITFARNPGILVANGLINIYSISGSVKGLTDLNNFELSATVKASVGPAVIFAGKTYALADVTGTINVTPKDLTLIGDVQMVGGYFGKGDFKGVLSWGSDPAKVTFDSKIQLYGGFIEGKMHAYIDIQGNVDFNASLGVRIPDAVPVVGGTGLGNLNIELRVRPAEPAAASYVRFGVSVLNFNGSVKASFDANVHYELNAEFFFFSINLSGDFSLRDASDDPTLQIVTATSLYGTPDGELVYVATTSLPDDTTIDLYADTTGTGNSGVLIGTVPYQAGTQTFHWDDMAAFAAPGKPVYVYGVIDDHRDPKVYSDYSAPFTVASGFVPVITSPVTVSYGAGNAVVFSAANGNAILIADPRKADDPESLVQVVLNVGGGAIDLSHAPDDVDYTGAGTGRMVLKGRADDITAALDGLIFAPAANSLSDDLMTITANNLPLQSLAGGVSATIKLNMNPLSISMIASQYDPGNAPNDIAIGESGQTPLQNLQLSDVASDYLTGATVTIDNYQRGQDLLGLAFADQIESGIDASFNPETGVLTLSGFESVNTYAEALQSLTYFTKSSTPGKKLTVAVADDQGERGRFSVPLAVSAAIAPPEIAINGFGLAYVHGMGATAVTPNADVTIPSGSLITGASVAFDPETYIAGEDVLSYSGTTIAGTFDPATGVLTLTGTGTAAEYSDALQHVLYENAATTLTPGQRFVTITVEDNAADNTTGSIISAIIALDSAATFASPTITVSAAHSTLPASDDELILDPEMTLSGDLPMLTGATVAITGGYVLGEDELGYGVLWDGMDASFDPATGVLTITGVASLADYEDVLRNVLLLETAGARTPGDLTVTITLNDGMTPGTSEDLTVTIADAPYLDAGFGDALIYTESRTAATLDAGIAIDHDAGLTGATIAIDAGFNVGEDELLFTNQNGITGSFDADAGILTLTGAASASDYQAALASIQYRNARFNPTQEERLISYQVQDGATASNVVYSIVDFNVDVVGPQIAVDATGPTFIEDGSSVAVAPSFTLTPADASETDLSAPNILYGAEIAIINYMPDEDVLAFTDTADIIGEWDAEEGRLILTGTASYDDYQDAIRSITYRNTSEVPTETARQIDIRLLDDGANGLQNNSVTTQLLHGVADLPMMTGATAGVTVLEGGAPVSLGLDQLSFSLPSGVDAADTDIVFVATALPSEALGAIENAAGEPIEVGQSYPIADLAGLRFVPALGGAGQADFRFDVLLADAATDNLETSRLSQSLQITVAGVTTTTSTEAYVAQVYRDAFGRNPNAATLAQLSHALDERFFGNTDAGGDERSIRSDFVDSLIAPGGKFDNTFSAIWTTATSDSDIFQRLLHRSIDDADSENFALDAPDLRSLVGAVLASDEYFARNATPSTTALTPIQETTAYPSVGTLGDAGGDKAGGTLIAPQYVLVAAHSVAGLPPGQLTFTIGGVVHHVTKVFLHPNYDPGQYGQDGANDIAILKLDAPADGIAPSQLWSGAPQVGDVLKLVGFGQQGGEAFGTKRVGSTPSVDNVESQIFQWTFESAFENNSDPGDSGSPLFITVNGVDYVIGVVSGGIDPSAGLGDVSTNTRVDAYLDWIQGIAGPLALGQNRASSPAVVNRVVPFVGPTSGGNTVVIVGANFVGITGLRFGGVNAVEFTVNSESQITAIAPAGAAATVDVTVETLSGASDTSGSGDDYTFAAPSITSVIINGGAIAARNIYGDVSALVGQQSVVEQIQVTFNERVRLDANVDGTSQAFKIASLATSVAASVAAPTTASVSVIATPVPTTGNAADGYSQYILTFSLGDGVNSFDNSRYGQLGNAFTTLKDGFYQLNTTGSAIHAGVSDTAADRADEFWALYGAVNAADITASTTLGDGRTNLLVDGVALGEMYNAFGSFANVAGTPAYKAAYDANLDGIVDGVDLGRMYANFGTQWLF